jgi:cleavage and polyadenylation specificity factor subunit 3
MFLEAQFGADAVAPITLPRHSVAADTHTGATAPQALSPEDKAELKRLHGLGIPVPGIEIKFDKYVAKVWLEDLDVECASNPLKARVRAVVERGVETVSGLWS